MGRSEVCVCVCVCVCVLHTCPAFEFTMLCVSHCAQVEGKRCQYLTAPTTLPAKVPPTPSCWICTIVSSSPPHFSSSCSECSIVKINKNKGETLRNLCFAEVSSSASRTLAYAPDPSPVIHRVKPSTLPFHGYNHYTLYSRRRLSCPLWLWSWTLQSPCTPCTCTCRLLSAQSFHITTCTCMSIVAARGGGQRLTL